MNTLKRIAVTGNLVAAPTEFDVKEESEFLKTSGHSATLTSGVDKASSVEELKYRERAHQQGHTI